MERTDRATDFVLVHGGGRGGWCWEPTIREMHQLGHSRLRRVVALDMPGAGKKKDVSPEECTLPGYVESAVRDILSDDLWNVVLVGHSFAGLTMPYVVTRIPERFKRVVFLACAVPPEGMSLHELRVMIGKVPPGPPQGANWQDPDRRPFRGEWDLGRTSRRLGRQRAEWLLENLQREMGKVFPVPGDEKVYRNGFAGLKPLTYIVTTKDRAIAPHWQRQYAHWLDGDRVEIVEIEADHDAMISKPREVAEALLRYA